MSGKGSHKSDQRTKQALFRLRPVFFLSFFSWKAMRILPCPCRCIELRQVSEAPETCLKGRMLLLDLSSIPNDSVKPIQ